MNLKRASSANPASGGTLKVMPKIDRFEDLEIWKNADPGIPELEDAKERLERLKDQAAGSS